MRKEKTLKELHQVQHFMQNVRIDEEELRDVVQPYRVMCNSISTNKVVSEVVDENLNLKRITSQTQPLKLTKLAASSFLKKIATIKQKKELSSIEMGNNEDVKINKDEIYLKDKVCN